MAPANTLQTNLLKSPRWRRTALRTPLSTAVLGTAGPEPLSRTKGIDFGHLVNCRILLAGAIVFDPIGQNSHCGARAHQSTRATRERERLSAPAFFPKERTRDSEVRSAHSAPARSANKSTVRTIRPLAASIAAPQKHQCANHRNRVRQQSLSEARMRSAISSGRDRAHSESDRARRMRAGCGRCCQ